MKNTCLALVFSVCFSSSCLAGGIALSSTRVIYDGNKKEASLTVNNNNKTEEFLIQSWVDDASGNKKTPFIITPPLFKLDPDKNNILRIVNITPSLPQDRESVYWVNVKAIPSKSEGSEEKKCFTDSCPYTDKTVLSSSRIKRRRKGGTRRVTFYAYG